MFPSCVHFVSIIRSIEAAKISQDESFRENIFSNGNVNRGSLVLSCSSLVLL